MVKPSPFEVRHKIDKKGSEFRSLVKSISEHGLLQPILVRPVTHGFEIVAGYRRFEACRSLGWRHIQSKIQSEIQFNFLLMFFSVLYCSLLFFAFLYFTLL